MSMHWEPFRALRDLDRLSSELLSGTRTPLTIPMDVWREGQSYRVALDIPGVDPGSIEVQLERNTLTVSGQREADFAARRTSAGAEPGAGAPQVLVAERPQGEFSRQLTLGEGLDTSAMQAEYRNGVLYLTIPVAQQAQPRKIQVGVGQGGAGQSAGQPHIVEGTASDSAGSSG
jgi:HSP20 family protein